MRYSKEKLREIYDRTTGCCHICHKKLAFKNYGTVGQRGAWEVEHSKPRAEGGSDYLRNLYPACISCNRSKGKKSNQLVRAKHGIKRAPLSKERRKKAKRANAVSDGLAGVAIGGYRHIVLDQEETTCVAPKPGEKDTMLPKNIWMVKGSVADAEGRGLGGVIVSLYDKDLLFDDRLGTTTTDEEGKYTLIYRTEAFRDLIKANPDLYIRVFDRSGKRIGSYRRKIKFEAGRAEVINITIGRKKKKGDSK